MSTSVLTRRKFFLGGSLVLAGVTAGRIRGLVSSTIFSGRSALPDPHSASFGWDIANIHNNGADVYFRVTNSITLLSVDVDVAFRPTSLGNGYAEVLCVGLVSRNGIPKFVPGVQAFISVASSGDFGQVQTYNPNNLAVTPTSPFSVGQDSFCGVILKTWVPGDGNASVTSRHVLSNPSLTVSANDYLVFHMDHAGVPGDVEMQVRLGYE